jgi:hypothetical protein
MLQDKRTLQDKRDLQVVKPLGVWYVPYATCLPADIYGILFLKFSTTGLRMGMFDTDGQPIMLQVTRVLQVEAF